MKKNREVCIIFSVKSMPQLGLLLIILYNLLKTWLIRGGIEYNF